MVCQRVSLGNGRAAIVCGPRQPQKRCACGRTATLLCDWKVAGNPGGTCNAPICEECATSPAPDKDLCPHHADDWKAWKARRGGAT